MGHLREAKPWERARDGRNGIERRIHVKAASCGLQWLWIVLCDWKIKVITNQPGAWIWFNLRSRATKGKHALSLWSIKSTATSMSLKEPINFSRKELDVFAFLGTLGKMIPRTVNYWIAKATEYDLYANKAWKYPKRKEIRSGHVGCHIKRQ